MQLIEEFVLLRHKNLPIEVISLLYEKKMFELIICLQMFLKITLCIYAVLYNY